MPTTDSTDYLFLSNPVIFFRFDEGRGVGPLKIFSRVNRFLMISLNVYFPTAQYTIVPPLFLLPINIFVDSNFYIGFCNRKQARLSNKHS